MVRCKPSLRTDSLQAMEAPSPSPLNSHPHHDRAWIRRSCCPSLPPPPPPTHAARPKPLPYLGSALSSAAGLGTALQHLLALGLTSGEGRGGERPGFLACSGPGQAASCSPALHPQTALILLRSSGTDWRLSPTTKGTGAVLAADRAPFPHWQTEKRRPKQAPGCESRDLDVGTRQVCSHLRSAPLCTLSSDTGCNYTVSFWQNPCLIRHRGNHKSCLF